MLPDLLVPMADHFQPFNLFRYLTFRTGGAVMTALFISFLFGGWLIDRLKTLQGDGQPIRREGPETHIIAKKGTPTMGGLLILGAFAVSSILWIPFSSPYLWPLLFLAISYGILGFVDDYLKLRRRSTRGVSVKVKLAYQVAIALITTLALVEISPDKLRYMLAIPSVKDVLLPLGVLYVPFAILVIVGASNAVNLTDGLDGLAIGPVIICALSFSLIAYLVGNAVYSSYLQLHYVPGTGELAVMCGALIGAGLGFLWYNAPPASVFMGDIGSLSLGGCLGAISVATRHELVLAIIGGLFVLETLSVIVQVISFRLTGKRVFAMAPIHHHFEKKGWAEPTIVIRFWIISVILALVGLATLKLR
ncbi:MAG: phospho-N-acetylmuramoyl-pentapeptide-transferase [Proteobacteria bacterium]|nr:phospho-N-acetylmuramoyl-pentapeptide-transferase [Pseudomonadota bacterium]